MIDIFFNMLNSSRLFAGCVMLLMNIGSRFIIKDIPDDFFEVFELAFVRYITVFCIVFITTRDVKISLFLTLCFIIIFKHFINKKSKLCLISKFENKKKKITKEKYHQALNIMRNYIEQN